MLQTPQLSAFCPDAVKFLDGLNEVCDRYAINTTLRRAHFLAQIAHESGGFKTTRENLNYTVEALLKMFGRHRISDADAKRYGRSSTQKANQEGIANCLYGSEWGAKNLGNTQAGDGWRFIGRGLKQITGRTNYRTISNKLFGDDRLLTKPEILEQPTEAVLSAGQFWADRKLNDLADRDDILAITKIVNGGTIGLDGRRDWLAKAKAALA